MRYLLWVTLLGLLAESYSEERPHPHPHSTYPPRPCKCPPEMQGSVILTARRFIHLSSYCLCLWISNGDSYEFGTYTYDEIGQRVRFGDFIQYKNQTFSDDVLLLYKEQVMYKINNENQTCSKQKLTGPFQPMEIPDDSTLLGQVVLGSFSEPGEGLLVNSWSGKTPTKEDKFFLIFTEFGCLPISILSYDSGNDWTVASYFNIIVGIKDPSQLTPPPFCLNATMESGGSGTLFSAFP
ncbi:hypothetical protein NFI96_019725 [Prochilodus magdalenae]|nr:hypothetical protein NFI96_019725 [Prochilodus magdalenae]